MTFSVIQGSSLELLLHFKKKTIDALIYDRECLVNVKKGYGIFNSSLKSNSVSCILKFICVSRNNKQMMMC